MLSRQRAPAGRQTPVCVPRPVAGSAFIIKRRDKGPRARFNHSVKSYRGERGRCMRQPSAGKPRPDHAQDLLCFSSAKLLDMVSDFSFYEDCRGMPSLRTVIQPPLRQQSSQFSSSYVSGLSSSCKSANGRRGTGGSLAGWPSTPTAAGSDAFCQPVKAGSFMLLSLIALTQLAAARGAHPKDEDQGPTTSRASHAPRTIETNFSLSSSPIRFLIDRGRPRSIVVVINRMLIEQRDS